MSEKAILDAIYDDDRATVKRLLRSDPALATIPVSKPRLFTGKFNHWIYVGDTPLHLAAAGYRLEIANLLVEAGAIPNAVLNHRRSSPLHYAADSCIDSPNWNPDRQTAMIRFLIDAGAEINAQDKNGAAPLHRAVRTRGAAAVRCLLELGAAPNLKNKPGSTPFHLAVQNTGRGGSGTEEARTAQREIIEEFLRIGANPKQKDGTGKTVFECAKSPWIRDLLSK